MGAVRNTTGDFTMATIGTFQKDQDGNFTGTIKTLTLNVKAAQMRKVETDNDKAPGFRRRPLAKSASTSRSSSMTRASRRQSTPVWSKRTTAST
jgi:hypothetical protein